MKQWAQKQKGFTIVELLIVIVVIAILAAISIVAYNGIQQRGRDAQRVSDINNIAKGMQLWSLDTGKSFQEMNSGNGTPANGWYDGNYGGGSVQSILVGGKYVSSNANDPLISSGGGNRWRYMVVPCTTDTADNRRVIMAELEIAPTQSVAQQVAGASCNHTQINTYVTTYKMNHARVTDAR